MQNLVSKSVIIPLIAGFSLIYLVSNFIVNERLSNSRVSVQTEIDTQLIKIKETVAIIGQSTFSTDTEKLVPECNVGERIETDDLLAKLDAGLNYQKIQRLDRVFASCGNVFAVRRGVMVADLKEQITDLEKLLKFKAVLGESTNDIEISQFNELLATEQSITAGLYKLVDVQRQIIAILQTNLTDRSQLEVLQVEAITTQNEMSQNSLKATELRSQILES